MFKSHILKEGVFATVIILVVTFLLRMIPLSNEFRKGVFQGFADFDIYDLFFSGKHLKQTNFDDNIVIAELGKDRVEIAEQIMTLGKYDPKVVGIDAFFESPKEEIDDRVLVEALAGRSNIVFANRFTRQPGYSIVPNIFSKNGENSGYANFVGNAYTVVRTYPSHIETGNKKEIPFSTAVIRIADPEKYERLIKRGRRQELINYSGNLENFISIPANDLLYFDSTGQLESLIKNKIVLLGFFVKQDPEKTIPLVLEDLHFTPMNERVFGKSFPDMYGVVIHANIISMILQGKYATLASRGASYLAAFILVLIFHLYMLSRYRKKEHPSHGVFLLVLFLGILLAIYLFLQVYNLFMIKIPLEEILIALVISLEMLGLYRNIALWLHKKYHYKTVFTHQHII